MRLKADLLLFMVAIIWGTAFVAQGVAGRYGIAYLFGKNLRQRARALIDIAHPDDREALEKSCFERFKIF